MIRSLATLAATTALLRLTRAALPADADETTIPATPSIGVSAKVSQATSRPKMLPVLYASYAALQAYDVYSTKQALAGGAHEANPLMQGATRNSTTFMAVKAISVVGAIVASERLWKTNKVAAIAVMVASNGIAAVVAARNTRVLSQQR